MLACACACAQAQADRQPQEGGTFYEPPAHVDPVYLPPPRSAGSPDAPPPSHSLLEVRLALDVPLRHGSVVGFTSQGARAASPTLQADVRWVPQADAPWFARVTFYRYLHAGEQQPWNPDYSYSFGYDDFRPGSWSLFYSNYTGTRLHPGAGLNQGRFNFDQGVWAVAYRFELPAALRPALIAGDGDAALCRVVAEWTPTFVDFASSSYRRNRVAAAVGCRYTRPDGWFAELTLYAYAQRDKQQPWDPDFTYAFGRWDWRPGTLSLQYSNYSGNRFPGRGRASGEGRFASGSITLSWRVDW